MKSLLNDPPDEYSTVTGVRAVATRTRPHTEAFEPWRNTASGSRKLVSEGFGLPSAKRRPDSKPPYS